MPEQQPTHQYPALALLLLLTLCIGACGEDSEPQLPELPLGSASFSTEEGLQLIDCTSGDVLGDYQYVLGNDKLRLATRMDGSKVFIDRKGQPVMEADTAATAFVDGIARLVQGDRHVFIDTQGQVLADEDQSIIGIAPGTGVKIKYDQKSQTTTLIDRDGAVIEELPRTRMFHWSGSLAMAFQYGPADSEDGFEIYYFNREGQRVAGPFEAAGELSDGMALIATDKGYGYIDGLGKIVIEPHYDIAFTFASGVAPVKEAGRWYLINRDGDVVARAPRETEMMRPCFGGVCPVQVKGGRWGAVDTQGRWIIHPGLTSIGSFAQGCAQAVKDDGAGVLDRHGNWLMFQDGNQPTPLSWSKKEIIAD